MFEDATMLPELEEAQPIVADPMRSTFSCLLMVGAWETKLLVMKRWDKIGP